MATAAQKTRSADDFTDPIAELGDKFVAGSKRVGSLYLDRVESSIATCVALEKKLAAQVPSDLVKNVIDAHADLTADLTKAYTTVARGTFV